MKEKEESIQLSKDAVEEQKKFKKAVADIFFQSKVDKDEVAIEKLKKINEAFKVLEGKAYELPGAKINVPKQDKEPKPDFS